jgi:hypothetical protein
MGALRYSVLKNTAGGLKKIWEGPLIRKEANLKLKNK